MRPTQLITVPIKQIEGRKQARNYFDQESLEGLAATATEDGYLQPIRVRKVGDKYIIIDGERRYRAALLKGLTDLNVLVVSGELTDAEIMAQSLLANIQREDLTPPDKAFGIKALMDATGDNCSEVAMRLGMTVSSVSRLLPIVSLPEAVRSLISAGKIPASTAPELAKIEDPTRLQEVAHDLASGKLTRDGVAKAEKRKKRASSRPSNTPTGRLIAMLGVGRVVSVIAPVLNTEIAIEILEDLLSRVRKAKGQNMSLATLARLLEDQCRT